MGEGPGRKGGENLSLSMRRISPPAQVGGGPGVKSALCLPTRTHSFPNNLGEAVGEILMQDGNFPSQNQQLK